MALDTVSLSDIGQSLVAIEAEIQENTRMILYYEEQGRALYLRNQALSGFTEALLALAVPALANRI